MAKGACAVHLALYFPGGYLPGQDPFDERLAWVTIRALEHAGAVVLPVRYDDALLQSDQARFDSGVRREVRGALQHHEPSRVTLVGKSRGTHALALACHEDLGLPNDTRMIWVTPVWRSDSSWEAACSNSLPSLHIVGLADHEYHLPDRHRKVAGTTVEIPDVDHRLEAPGDIFRTLDAWRTMASAIVHFASRAEG
jgi:hypothetical protein